jgi:hypothetical protein
VQRLHEKVILLNHPETKAGRSQSELADSLDSSLLVSTSGKLQMATGKLDEGDKTDTEYYHFQTPSNTCPDYERYEETGDWQGPLQPLQESSGGRSAALPVSSAAARAARGQIKRPVREQASSPSESAVLFESLYSLLILL